jgi:hypothetical protein
MRTRLDSKHYRKPRKTLLEFLGIRLKSYERREARAWKEHCKMMQEELDKEKTRNLKIRFYDGVFLWETKLN